MLCLDATAVSPKGVYGPEPTHATKNLPYLNCRTCTSTARTSASLVLGPHSPLPLCNTCVRLLAMAALQRNARPVLIGLQGLPLYCTSVILVCMLCPAVGGMQDLPLFCSSAIVVCVNTQTNVLSC